MVKQVISKILKNKELTLYSKENNYEFNLKFFCIYLIIEQSVDIINHNSIFFDDIESSIDTSEIIVTIKNNSKFITKDIKMPVEVALLKHNAYEGILHTKYILKAYFNIDEYKGFSRFFDYPNFYLKDIDSVDFSMYTTNAFPFFDNSKVLIITHDIYIRRQIVL